ncbi:LysR family transcriptional regulator ArgP [Aeromicrobium sp. CTD01-1L150]|uniref:LysR family transcriptional regulator ArgP n=1 Tax=Aeromicrobium sp. CTD01-1L150 TaxID=3341830 RepID=UPI0035C05D6A
MSWNAELVATFAAVVDTGTFDGAARQLHMTPSAVSQRIKTLEQQVGRRLAVRSRPVTPTDAGRAVLRHAQRLALLEHDLTTDLGVDPPGGFVRMGVAVNADSLATWFLDPLATFAAEHEVALELHREDQERTARLLTDGVVMAAVTSRSTPVPGCRVEPLGALMYVPVAAPAWIQRWDRGSTGETLAHAPRVDYDRHDTLQVRWLSQQDVTAPTAARHLVPSSHDFARAVELGLGWGLLPVQHAEPMLEDGRLVTLDGPPISTPLWWQYWSSPSDTLAALTDVVLTHAQVRLVR